MAEISSIIPRGRYCSYSWEKPDKPCPFFVDGEGGFACRNPELPDIDIDDEKNAEIDQDNNWTGGVFRDEECIALYGED